MMIDADTRADASGPISVLADPSPTSVALTLRTPVAPPLAWEALSAPARLGMWFGAFEGELRAGGRGRFEFGDGDFFDVTVDELRAPVALGYRWRFLGTGPECRIRWTLQPDATGTAIRVDDDQPGRGPADRAEMHEGWTDFLERLDRHLATGGDARYGWSKNITGSILLNATPEAAARQLLQPEARAAWLPLSPPPRGNGAAGSPATRAWTATTTALSRDAKELRLEITSPSWRAPTQAAVRVAAPNRGPTLLSIRHDGWAQVSGDEASQLSERRAACARWVAALRAAAEVVDAGLGGGDVA
jgi:uncharacterized protein YndB with AHSA1/START domain